MSASSRSHAAPNRASALLPAMGIRPRVGRATGSGARLPRSSRPGLGRPRPNYYSRTPSCGLRGPSCCLCRPWSLCRSHRHATANVRDSGGDFLAVQNRTAGMWVHRRSGSCFNRASRVAFLPLRRTSTFVLASLPSTLRWVTTSGLTPPGHAVHAATTVDAFTNSLTGRPKGLAKPYIAGRSEIDIS